MANILVVDDDPHLRQLVVVTLTRAGFGASEAATGRDAWETLNQSVIDLAVIDIMMPDMDGWSLCTRIRDAMNLPIVMLTALGDTSQKIRGLQLGADDYLTKPFDPAELLARIKAVLRRFHIQTDQVVRMGPLQLDSRSYQMTWHDQDVPIPPKEFALLFYMASYPGQTLLREKLIDAVWGYDFEGDERTLDVHIKRLRGRFPEAAPPFRIRTVRGLGYRLEVINP